MEKRTNSAVIDNEASRAWLSALQSARDVFENAGLPKWKGAPDTSLYDVKQISEEASRIVSKKANRKEGQTVSWHLSTFYDFAEKTEKVIVEWFVK